MFTMYNKLVTRLGTALPEFVSRKIQSYQIMYTSFVNCMRNIISSYKEKIYVIALMTNKLANFKV